MITISLWSYIVDQIAIVVLLLTVIALVYQMRKTTKVLREINEQYRQVLKNRGML